MTKQLKVKPVKAETRLGTLQISLDHIGRSKTTISPVMSEDVRSLLIRDSCRPVQVADASQRFAPSWKKSRFLGPK